MITILLHLVGLRPRVYNYYTLTNFRGDARVSARPLEKIKNGRGVEVTQCGWHFSFHDLLDFLVFLSHYVAVMTRGKSIKFSRSLMGALFAMWGAFFFFNGDLFGLASPLLNVCLRTYETVAYLRSFLGGWGFFFQIG